MSVRSYLQGSFMVPADATIRFTYDPSGTPQTSDWSVTRGQSWNSADELLAAWTAQLQADVSSSCVASAVDVAAAQYLHIATGGPTYSIDFSHAGDGSALRGFLGLIGNPSNLSPGQVAGAELPAAVVFSHHVRRVLRGGTSRRVAQRQHLVGNGEAIHGTSPGQADDTTYTLEVRLGGGTVSAAGAARARLEGALEAIIGTYLEPLSVFHRDGQQSTAEQWVLCFAQEDVELVFEQVNGAKPFTLFDCRFRMQGVSSPW